MADSIFPPCPLLPHSVLPSSSHPFPDFRVVLLLSSSLLPPSSPPFRPHLPSRRQPHCHHLFARVPLPFPSLLPSSSRLPPVRPHVVSLTATICSRASLFPFLPSSRPPPVFLPSVLTSSASLPPSVRARPSSLSFPPPVLLPSSSRPSSRRQPHCHHLFAHVPRRVALLASPLLHQVALIALRPPRLAHRELRVGGEFI